MAQRRAAGQGLQGSATQLSRSMPSGGRREAPPKRHMHRTAFGAVQVSGGGWPARPLEPVLGALTTRSPKAFLAL